MAATLYCINHHICWKSETSSHLPDSTYQNADIADLAAAYGFGISRNHPFLDGNKRTAFVVVELFLNLNGQELEADDTDCLHTFLSLSAGTLSENDLATWLRANICPVVG